MFVRADQGTDLGEAVLPTFKWVRKKDQNRSEPKSSKNADKNEAETQETPQQSVASDYKVTLN